MNKDLSSKHKKQRNVGTREGFQRSKNPKKLEEKINKNPYKLIDV